MRKQRGHEQGVGAFPFLNRTSDRASTLDLRDCNADPSEVQLAHVVRKAPRGLMRRGFLNFEVACPFLVLVHALALNSSPFVAFYSAPNFLPLVATI